MEAITFIPADKMLDGETDGQSNAAVSVMAIFFVDMFAEVAGKVGGGAAYSALLTAFMNVTVRLMGQDDAAATLQGALDHLSAMYAAEEKRRRKVLDTLD